MGGIGTLLCLCLDGIMKLLHLILSWSQSNLVQGWSSPRLFMSNRRLTWLPCEGQPASEGLWLLLFPFSSHSALWSICWVLGHRYKLETVPVSKEFTTLWEKTGKKWTSGIYSSKVGIVRLLGVRLFWTWDKLVGKTVEIAALGIITKKLFYQEGTMNNKQTKEMYYQFFQR